MAEYKYQNTIDFVPTKVRKRGKLFELLVSRLEESLRDHKTVKIYTDHQVKNIDGYSRQFDVFIEAFVQEYPIQIAIECKEFHTKAVDVTAIESFSAKCQNIPTINKKVFVSQTGYSKQAIIEAKRYGIDLLMIDELDESDLFNWTDSLEFYLEKRYIRLKSIKLLKSNGEEIYVNDKGNCRIRLNDSKTYQPIDDVCHSLMFNLSIESWSKVTCEFRSNKPMLIEGGFRSKSKFNVLWQDEFLECGTVEFDAYVFKETIKLTKGEIKVYKDILSCRPKTSFLKMEGKGVNGEKAIGELVIPSNRQYIKLNVGIIEEEELVYTHSSKIDIAAKV